MKRLGLLVTALLLLTGCGQFGSPDPEFEQQGLSQQQTEPTKHDYTEDPQFPSQTEYAIVTFRSPPAASYEGGISDLDRTKPEPGQEFDEDHPAVQAYLRHLENEHANFRSFLQRGAPQAEIVEEYFITINGFAVKLNGASLAELKRGPDVKAADYSALYRPTMNKSVGLVGATEFWNLGFTGEGVNVAVIDSGIEREHPFFACKVVGDGGVYASGVAFDPSRVLVVDHGTHVAGTIGGCSGTDANVPGLDIQLSGVAPGAALFDFNVFPGFGAGYVAYGGSAFSHDIAEAIEDAVVKDMNVINMSLGGGVQGPNDFLAEASNAAVDAGVVVVSSAGNSGPGQYTVGSPASAEKVLAVAATTNSHTFVLPLFVDFDGAGPGSAADYDAAEGDFDPFRENPADDRQLVLAADYGDELACAALDSELPDGTVVLIRRGTCTFSSKIANAAAAGAFGAVVYNNIADEGPIAMAGESEIPAVGISLQAGQEILAGFEPGATTVSINGNELSEEPLAAGMLANFSSRGPAPFTGVIKPEIAAPGVNILSSVFGGEYAMFNGTSMASPHVAGAAALLLSANPDLSAEEVKALLINGAEPALNPVDDEEYAVHAAGNGSLNVVSSAELDFLVSPPTASFGFHNLGGKSRVDSVELTVNALNDPLSCSIDLGTSKLEVDSTSFRANPTANVTVSVANGTRWVGDSEGYLTVTCGGKQVRVPWASYSDANVPF